MKMSPIAKTRALASFGWIMMSSFRLESPTRSLGMNAPKGVHLKALAGNIEVASNMDVILQSAAGLVSLFKDALCLNQHHKPGFIDSAHRVSINLVKFCGAAKLIVYVC